MIDVLVYLISAVVTAVLIGAIVLVKKWYDVLKEKANELYDHNRNTKVGELLGLVTTSIDDAIGAVFIEKDIAEITEEDLTDLVDDVSERIETLVGQGVINYLMSTFVDNWDDWIYEKILSRLSILRNQ